MLLFLVCLGFDIFVYYSFFKLIREQKEHKQQQEEFQRELYITLNCLCSNSEKLAEVIKENKRLKQQIKNLEKEKVIENGNN